MSGPTHERTPPILPVAHPRRPSRPWLAISIFSLVAWAAVVALMALRIL